MDFVDPYIDPVTGILKNLLGALTAEELAEREAQMAAEEMDLSALKDMFNRIVCY